MQNDDEARSPYEGLAEKIRGGKSASTIEFENRKPTIRVTRLSNRSGFRRGMRLLAVYEMAINVNLFSVFLNGDLVAQLRQGQSVQLEADAGQNELIVKTPVASNGLAVHLENGMRVKFSCCAGLSGIVLTKTD